MSNYSPASHMAVPGELRDAAVWRGGGVEELSLGHQERLSLGYHGTWLLKPGRSFENQKRRWREHFRKKGTCCRSDGTVCREMGRARQDRFPPHKGDIRVWD